MAHIMMECILLLLTCLPFSINGKSILLNVGDYPPLDISDSNKNINFNLTLPNNDIIEIGLSFKLMTFTNAQSNHSSNTTLVEDVEKSIAVISSEAINPVERRYVTVEEAIEGFRLELIRRESEISGIIESKDVFYRHFKLEFDENKELTIRCTYNSFYAERSLNISCFEYREYKKERVLSNGVVEIVNVQEPEYQSDVELVDLKSMKQTYNMNIS